MAHHTDHTLSRYHQTSIVCALMISLIFGWAVMVISAFSETTATISDCMIQTETE